MGKIRRDGDEGVKFPPMATITRPPAASQTAPSIALLGNPNTGKSTLFNALAGARQRVGNYPGCTVEKKTGHMTHDDRRFELVDLPGTYSLAPRSPDEMVAVDVLLGRRPDTRKPDALLCIVDASNLERNLYLVSQALELGLPTVLALNMVDVAQDRGVTIDIARLSKQLGLPVVELQAHKRVGIQDLKAALAGAIGQVAVPPASPFPAEFQEELRQIENLLGGAKLRGGAAPGVPRYLVERLLLDTSGYLAGMIELRDAAGETKLQEALTAARTRLAAAGAPVPAVEAMSRYAWVAKVLDGVVTRPSTRRVTASDRIDKVLTHKVLGTVVFALVMGIMFQSVFSWASPAMELIDGAIGNFSDLVKGAMAEGPIRSLITDGIIAGVGMVLVFLPQILILFFFIAILEDCGYMARAAYLMDKLMAGVGLSGKSFIPLLSSFACAIPGVMATRVIENPRDRLTTILVAPLMSCSARLPVYGLLIGAFIPPVAYAGGWIKLQGITFVCMYLVGIVAAVFVALILKKTILRGETPPFVMELPSYKFPSPWTVSVRIVDRGWSFVRRAGTLILLMSVVVWWATYYPHDSSQIDPALFAREEALAPEVEQLEEIVKPDVEMLEKKYALLAALARGEQPKPEPVEEGKEAAEPEELDAAGLLKEQRKILGEVSEILSRLDAKAPGYAEKSDELQAIRNEIAGTYVRNSYLGRFGQAIEPAVRPLGWDWRIGAAAIASFPAREVVVATLGVIYNLGAEEDEESQSLRGTLKEATWDPGSPRAGEKVYNIPVALSLMVFFALCAQCAPTLAVIKRETNSWWWPIFTFLYMTGLAYVAALVTYQVGSRIG